MGAVNAAKPVEFRPTFGKFLTVAIGLICITALLWTTADVGVVALIEVGPWLMLVAGACWAAFWNPRIVVDDGGVRLVNVTRTIDLPWPSIQAVDTKFALTLITAHGKFTGWAAPAPGAHAAVRATRGNVKMIPDSAWGPGGIRPGDLPSTPSGNAALLIRQRWQTLRDAGHLDSPLVEHERAPIHWHWRMAGIAAALVILGVIGLYV
ncbi:MAG: PH domain-containing protein [Ilumatobacteraceae bacterium]